MVDVSAKPVMLREAVASGEIRLQSATLELIESQTIAKGNVLAAARLAGILAAKKTGELIPLCHPLPLTHCEVNFDHPQNPRPDCHHRFRQNRRANGRGNGGPDRGKRRRPHDLRHVQGGGQDHAPYQCEAGVQDKALSRSPVFPQPCSPDFNMAVSWRLSSSSAGCALAEADQTNAVNELLAKAWGKVYTGWDSGRKRSPLSRRCCDLRRPTR